MGKHIFYVIAKKLHLFRILLRTLIRILLILAVICIFIIAIPGLLENITNLLTGLLKYLTVSLIGLFEHIINSIVSMVIEAQIPLKIYKIIKAIAICFIIITILLIIFKAINWAKSTFIAPLENGIDKFVYLYIIQIIPLFAKYYFKNKDIEKKTKELKNVEYEMGEISITIRDYERRKTKFQKEYGGGELTEHSEFERNLLLASISNQYQDREELKEKCSACESEINMKKLELNNINKEARDLIINKKWYWDEKYKRGTQLKNKIFKYLQDIEPIPGLDLALLLLLMSQLLDMTFLYVYILALLFI